MAERRAGSSEISLGTWLRSRGALLGFEPEILCQYALSTYDSMKLKLKRYGLTLQGSRLSIWRCCASIAPLRSLCSSGGTSPDESLPRLFYCW